MTLLRKIVGEEFSPHRNQGTSALTKPLPISFTGSFVLRFYFPIHKLEVVECLQFRG